METITEGLKEQFAKNIQLIIQQEGSKLKKYVTTGTQDTEIISFESMDTHEAEARNRVVLEDNPMYGHYRDRDDPNELEQIKFKVPTITRRFLTAAAQFWTATMDRNDKLNLLSDPTSHFPKMAAYAMGRLQDKTIIKAFADPVRGGRTGNKTINFDLTNNVIPTGMYVGEIAHGLDQLVAANDNEQIVEENRAGLTVEKLIKAHYILKKRSFGMFNKLYMLCSSRQISDLLHDPQITSHDYNNVRALVSGEVNSFMGFTFITSEMLGGIHDKYYAVRDCYAFNEGAVRFNTVNGSVKKDIQEMLTYHFAKVLYYSEAFGAVRDNERAVVTIKCLEKYDDSTHKGDLWEESVNADNKRGVHANMVPWQMFGAECRNVANDNVIDDDALKNLSNAHIAPVKRAQVVVMSPQEIKGKKGGKGKKDDEDGDGSLFD